MDQWNQTPSGAPNGDFFYFYDGSGSVSQVAEAGGTVWMDYAYDAWGNQTYAAGNGVGWGVFGYSTKEMGAPGMLFYGERVYRPDLARWMSRDPIGEAGGVNLYGFVGNDPLNYSDEYGLIPAPLPPVGLTEGSSANELNYYPRKDPYIYLGMDAQGRRKVWNADNAFYDYDGKLGMMVGGFASGPLGGFGGMGLVGAMRSNDGLGSSGALRSSGGFKGFWIQRSLYQKLPQLCGQDAGKFASALQKGVVGRGGTSTGVSGVIELSPPHGNYTHELKIGGSANRLLGRADKGGMLVFDHFERGGLHKNKR